MIHLLVNTPVSIADSGHRSLISKTMGIRLNKEIKYPDMPTNRGGEVTITTSYLPLNLKSPAHSDENIKEKYPHNRPKNPLLYDSETWVRCTNTSPCFFFTKYRPLYSALFSEPLACIIPAITVTSCPISIQVLVISFQREPPGSSSSKKYWCKSSIFIVSFQYIF